MPHTDTNISRDALRSYGMQPARRLKIRRIWIPKAARSEYTATGKTEAF